MNKTGVSCVILFFDLLKINLVPDFSLKYHKDIKYRLSYLRNNIVFILFLFYCEIK